MLFKSFLSYKLSLLGLVSIIGSNVLWFLSAFLKCRLSSHSKKAFKCEKKCDHQKSPRAIAPLNLNHKLEEFYSEPLRLKCFGDLQMLQRRKLNIILGKIIFITMLRQHFKVSYAIIFQIVYLSYSKIIAGMQIDVFNILFIIDPCWLSWFIMFTHTAQKSSIPLFMLKKVSRMFYTTIRRIIF